MLLGISRRLTTVAILHWIRTATSMIDVRVPTECNIDCCSSSAAALPCNNLPVYSSNFIVLITYPAFHCELDEYVCTFCSRPAARSSSGLCYNGLAFSARCVPYNGLLSGREATSLGSVAGSDNITEARLFLMQPYSVTCCWIKLLMTSLSIRCR